MEYEFEYQHGQTREDEHVEDRFARDQRFIILLARDEMAAGASPGLERQNLFDPDDRALRENSD